MRPHCFRVPGRRQRGQALTETIVACLVLVPLFLLMPLIGKYQDMAHSTLMASRYVAHEATIRNPGSNNWKSENQLAQEVRRRFFSNSNAPIKTNDSAGNFAAHRNLAWTDGFGNPLITDINRDVVVSFGAARGTTHGQAFSASSDGTPFSSPGLSFNNFGLTRQGIYTANVSVAVANLPANLRFTRPFDTLNLVITRSSSTLIDTWAAPNAFTVQQRLDNNVVHPGRVLAVLNTPVDLLVRAADGDLIGLSSIRGPRLGGLDYWRDVIPPDRLR
jgi:hypothetical protein